MKINLQNKGIELEIPDENCVFKEEDESFF